MLNLSQLVQLIYTIPLTIFYYYFTILLTYKIIIKKDSYFNNGFYPLILLKSYADLIDITNSFISIRFPRWNVASQFFLQITWLPYLFYMEICITYNAMLFCSLLTSLNRFVAIKYPLKYGYWFSSRMLKVYIFITLSIGIIFGCIVLTYHPYYQWSNGAQGYFVSFKNKNVGIFTVCYTFILYLPCAVLAISLNVITAFELKKYRNKLSINVKKELPLFFYSIVSLVFFLLFFLYFLFRALHTIFYIPMLQKIAIIAIPWIMDIQTFGLFYSSLIICSPLRNMVLFKGVDDN
uniref:G_PROTEIN_RECEP_F1_2 domain-containing protein n=1 Tax=Strongyloides venezuelensis TaxID=75913 RepID=A0A0K0F0J5_STRVS